MSLLYPHYRFYHSLISARYPNNIYLPRQTSAPVESSILPNIPSASSMSRLSRVLSFCHTFKHSGVAAGGRLANAICQFFPGGGTKRQPCCCRSFRASKREQENVQPYGSWLMTASSPNSYARPPPFLPRLQGKRLPPVQAGQTGGRK